MALREAIATDLVVSGFGADARRMVDVARCAEESGFDGVHVLDHFSGAMLGHQWAREPFTVLGAMAVATETVRLGPLVANVVNRHIGLLASAASTLQSLARGRVVLGLGAGAAPGSRFAGEHAAIGVEPSDGPTRRSRLAETVGALHALWAGEEDFSGEVVSMRGLGGVIGLEQRPPIVIGASGARSVELACRIADGLNLRVSDRVDELIALVHSSTDGRAFELSVHDFADLDHPLGGDPHRWIALGVDRRTLAVRPPFDLDRLAALGDRLNR